MESNDEKDALLRQRRGGEDGKGELVVVSEPVGVEEEGRRVRVCVFVSVCVSECVCESEFE